MYKAAILGATGYTGMELMRLLLCHPEVEPVFLGSGSRSGISYSEIHPQFRNQVDLVLQPMELDQIPDETDVVFCALPHGESSEIVAKLHRTGFKVIDLSADYRLKDLDSYRQWYSLVHPEPELLEDAVYGLPELYKDEIRKAKLVANPGCYPTSIILGLAPLLSSNLVDLKNIIIDSKSGVSGAGSKPKQAFHFPECTENFKAYRIAAHQHIAEIEQELGRLAGTQLKVVFTPHLIPMVRGILSTIYLDPQGAVEQADLEELYIRFYKKSVFVRYIADPNLPETRYVRGSNYCDLAVRYDKRTNKIIVISVIDNLVKGASGQAVQNLNIMLGLPENCGLQQGAL